MKHILTAVAGLILFLPGIARGQARPTEFQLMKISPSMITGPDYTYSGAQRYKTDQRARWLEVEVEFAATPEFTDELTFKYYVLFNGKLLTGEVTHVAIPAGRELRSVMYVSPRVMARLNNNRVITQNSVQNITIQILQGGTLKDEMNLTRAPAQWYSQMQAITGLLLNKNDTPFAPIYWDRYEQIKTSAAR